MRTIRNVRQLVPGQVILALQRCIADVADETPFNRVRDDVLLDQRPVRIRHLALGTTEERGPVQRLRLPDLAWLRSRLLLAHCSHLGCLLRLFLLLLAGGRGRGHLTGPATPQSVPVDRVRGRRTASRGSIGRSDA